MHELILSGFNLCIIWNVIYSMQTIGNIVLSIIISIGIFCIVQIIKRIRQRLI